MSADLLAAFGQDSQPPTSSAGNRQAAQSQTNPLIPSPTSTDDDFFSSLSNPDLPTGSIPNPPSPAVTQRQPQPPGFEFFNLPRHDNSDVLFDAEIDIPTNETEDEWGDFEGPEATVATVQPQRAPNTIPQTEAPATQHQAAQIDLLDSLSLNDPPQNLSITTKKSQNVSMKSQVAAPASNPPESTWDDDSFGDWGEFTDTPSTNPPTTQRQPPKPKPKAKPAPRKPITKNPLKPTPQNPGWEDEFEDWGDFNDGPTPAAPKQTISKQPPSPALAQVSFTSSTSPSSTVRPTNIPPPSVLLSLLVEILSNLQKEALQSRASEQESREETATRIQITLSTAARIIAGRSLRWKRDSILSQSMRIGPAGKSGGMKLSTVNKHEDVKESQDAVEVLSLWRERAALFNSVVQGVGQKPVPVVGDPAALKVVVAKVEDGAIKASHACALCALRRDERVLRIDEGVVNDSFGEWWTEHWGHTGCRVFWERYKELLVQR
ncbi:uncharacterized protein N7483_000533 [Penicillium malachiteum]|uniref:uncharacterized protein n=1 Tax=Penicillium malachiteum TaxID=1324776 RepID=UPI002548E63E|nr:uncharacterized protein N7483_000533 [Penicillium malachiteum]KAJ5735408.1 hypothetical protein N7483_000533 [Penicillium malachiteum]